MRDPRYARLAQILVHHSTRVERGQKVLIEAFDIPPDFTAELIRTVVGAGGLPIVSTYQQSVLRALYHAASDEQMRFIGEVEMARMTGVQAYIGVRGSHNISEYADVPQEKMAIFERLWWKPVHVEYRVKRTNWVILRWPTPSMAQAAGKSTEAFEDYYFDVCAGVDYAAMSKAQQPLVELLTRTKRVHITGPGTDLTFDKTGIPAIECSGRRNIPDGECFTCPVKDSVNGTVTFNTESPYHGTVFNNVKLTFHGGRITAAAADSPAHSAKLNEILDTDEGARYIGEWSLAFNPYITEPLKDILFDEKIAGSFHLTPGQAYEVADNGNRSQVHWDIVMMQDMDHGGGEVYFDDVLIRKDGIFVIKELAGLNPDRLRK